MGDIRGRLCALRLSKANSSAFNAYDALKHQQLRHKASITPREHPLVGWLAVVVVVVVVFEVSDTRRQQQRKGKMKMKKKMKAKKQKAKMKRLACLLVIRHRRPMAA